MLIARTLKDKRLEKRDKIIKRKKYLLKYSHYKLQGMHGKHPLPLKNYYNLKYIYNCSSFFQRNIFSQCPHSVTALSMCWRLRVLEQGSSNIRLIIGEFIGLETLVWGTGLNPLTRTPGDGANLWLGWLLQPR